MIRLSHRRRNLLFGAVAPLLLAIAACAGSEDRARPSCAQLEWSGPQEGTSLILVVNDTMRRDRVGAYGGLARTPAFDRFASENLRFDRAHSQAPWTKPSIATLFTSLFPSQHGNLTPPTRVVSDGQGGSHHVTDVLSDELTTLAEVLRRAGYATGAFVGNPWLEPRNGFAQGFDVYDDSFADFHVDGTVVSRAGLEWLRGLPEEQPYFLYLHYMDSHRPYRHPSRWDVLRRYDRLREDRRLLEPHAVKMIGDLVWLDERMPAVEAGLRPSIELLTLAYDKGIEAFDHTLAGLLDELDRLPTFAGSALMVTSDHGEALFEHGVDNHGNSLYEEELAIPMAARLPGVAATGDGVDCPVGLIDVLPTVCSYLDLECPEPIFGRSLLGASRISDDEILGVVSEGVIAKPRSRTIRDDTYKLIWQPDGGLDGKLHTLFNIIEDPAETRDLLLEPGDAASRAFDRLSDRVVRAVPPFDAPPIQSVPLDSEQEERLRALGYIN